jgi:hypothetical protein
VIDLAGRRAANTAAKHPELEYRDIHEADEALSVAMGDDYHSDWKTALRAVESASVPHGGKVLADVGGMGKVYDWRDSPWTPANGGKIVPRAGLHHIPVIHQAKGIADFVTLRNVLVAQGLMVQRSTDGEGNVALFVPNDVLCFQARGLNQQSWGCEHMHFTTGEEWSRAQLRAAAWVIWHAKQNVGTPLRKARLVNGGVGIARVVRTGQTTHEREADAAGFHDRSDPGELFFVRHWAYVMHCVHFYAAHKTMRGA